MTALRTLVPFEVSQARSLLPSISFSDNKATRGRSLLIAGSTQYPGAGILAARACLRSGSGYVILGQQTPSFISLENPDFLVLNLEQESIKKQKFDALAMGPGCGVNEFTRQQLTTALEMNLESVVVDADALTVLAQHSEIKPLPSWILTPHEGELSRLMSVSAEVIRQDRFTWVARSQEKFGCVVLLKGSGTLVADAQRILEIHSGNPALAKSGTGDVLTGMITAFIAQGLSSIDAAGLGAFVHGFAADLWVSQGNDPLSLMASDLIELIPTALSKVRAGLALPK